jgi:DNA-directed RNA polymerase omega subunit
MARITVEGCLDKVQSRFELILLAQDSFQQLVENHWLSGKMINLLLSL